jgi:VanZ family protein
MGNLLKHPWLMKIITSLYLALLLTLTHLPKLGPLPEVPGKDKTLHFVAYFIAALFCHVAFASQARPLRKLFLIVASLMTMGALDEITQPYVNRTCDICDWFADISGIGVATILYSIYLFQYKFSKTENSEQ